MPDPAPTAYRMGGTSRVIDAPTELDLQPSLWDGADTPAPAPMPTGDAPAIGHSRSRGRSVTARPPCSRTAPQRYHLEHGAWVDHQPFWLHQADSRFFELSTATAWRSERRQMYDRTVDVPRLVSHYRTSDTFPVPWLPPILAELNQYYQADPSTSTRDRLVSAGLCLYRDGRDSVAWHGDRIGRGRHEDTLVAIVSMGSPRTLRLRPNGGGDSISFELGHGDLFVMGGSCQRTYEHAVPKTASSVGPRISVQFRPRDVA